MPSQLKNLDVQWISLVKNPANGLPLLLKDANAKPFRVLKTDEERQIAYGIVYAPDVVDSQGDQASRQVIERAAHAFLKAGRTGQVDQQHQFEPLPGAYVAESWIVRGNDQTFDDVTPYAWAVGIKVDDPALWAAIKSGEYSGISLAGVAERESLDAPSPPAPLAHAGEGSAAASEGRTLKAVADLLAPLKMRLDEIHAAQATQAERVAVLEKQRLSADHAGPAAPKNWLREVL